MSFRIADDEVFLLAGGVATAGPMRLVETRAEGARPVECRVTFRPAAERFADVRLTWKTIGAARRAAGDVVDLRLELCRRGDGLTDPAGAAHDVIDLAFPLDVAGIHDPDFATVAAAAFRCSDPSRLGGVEMIVWSQTGAVHVHPIAPAAVGHAATGFRFSDPPGTAIFGLRFHLTSTGAIEDPLVIDVGRLFVGFAYDPYRFSPHYEYAAHRRPFEPNPAFASVASDFVAAARALSRDHRFLTSQSFILPFEVRREGEPDFSMLCGTVNSLYWYGQTPSHGCEVYRRDGFVVPGDVVFDCGAHAGQMSAYFAAVVGPRGRVYAFDPFPQNTLQIEAQAALGGFANLTAVRAGVGERSETILVPNAVQMTVPGDDCGLDDRLTIAIRRLDDFVDLAPTAIKLDVEGAEVGAIRGAAEVLRRHRPKILCEFHTQLVGAFGHSVQDFLDAIPLDLYDVEIVEEGASQGPQPYLGGPVAWTSPGLITAIPKPAGAAR